MKKYIPFLLLFLSCSALAQMGINATGTAPASAAMLDVSSTNKGVLVPRMTTVQKNAIQNPVEGLMVYDTDVKQFSYCLAIFAGTAVNCQWVNFGNTQVPPTSWNVNGNDISNANTGNVGIGNTNPQSVLDVQGDIRFRSSNITLASGFSGELDATTTKASVYNLNGNVTITGINGGVDGRILTIVNTTSTTQIRIKLIDENDVLSTSNISNKISLGNTFLILYGGSIVLRYDGYKQHWTIVSKNNVNDGSVATWQQSGNDLNNSNTGNVGIGTSSPAAKLDVAGTIKISDGTQANGRLLTSDASGTASWQNPISTGFKNLTTFIYDPLNTTQNWIVPAGVTKIMLEGWGAGGGGDIYNISGTQLSGQGGGGGVHQKVWGNYIYNF